MKKAFVVLLVAVGLIAAAGSAFADPVAASYGTVKVNVLSQQTLYHDATRFLNFGMVGSPANETKVKLAPNGSETPIRTVPTGSRAILFGTDASCTLDYFTSSVVATPTYLANAETYYVGFDDSVAIDGMTVSDFTAYIGPSTASFFSKTQYDDITNVGLLVSGATSYLDFFVGATLTIPASTSSGHHYSGTYNVYLGYDAVD